MKLLSNVIEILFQNRHYFEMECQIDKNEYLLFFVFNQGHKAAKVAWNICALYGDEFIADRMAQKWFTHFKMGKFKLTDSLHSHWPVQFHENQFHMLIKEELHQTPLGIS